MVRYFWDVKSQLSLDSVTVHWESFRNHFVADTEKYKEHKAEASCES